MRRSTSRRCALAGVLAVALAAGCGGDPATTASFTDPAAHFQFTYPVAFVKGFSNVGSEVDGRPPTFKATVGIDATNVVIVATYPLRKPFESYGGHEKFRSVVDTAARTIVRFEGARITKLVDRALGPLAGYGYDVLLPDGATHEELTFAFKGSVEYFLRCHWDASGAKAVPAACTMARTTFALAT